MLYATTSLNIVGSLKLVDGGCMAEDRFDRDVVMSDEMGAAGASSVAVLL